MAILLSLKCSKPLGGILALSGFQAINEENIEAETKKIIAKTPLLIYNGSNDKLIPVKKAQKTYQWLRKCVYKGKYRKNFTFVKDKFLKHKIWAKEIECIRLWLFKRFKEIGKKDAMKE